MHGRQHGDPPYKCVVVHGGPGAPGSALGIALLLPSAIEPYQTAKTVEGQIDELAQAVSQDAEPPVVLIGHSWGAMLALLTAAKYPGLVAKAILVCSGGFSAEAYAQTNENRMSRLSAADRKRAEEIKQIRKERPEEGLAELTLEYYEIISKADAFDPDPDLEDGTVEFQNDVNKSVWSEAAELRESGELLERISSVRCPVVAIHGDYDPHPAVAVEVPLATALNDFRMIVIPKCGHEPWKERQARDEFARILLREIGL